MRDACEDNAVTNHRVADGWMRAIGRASVGAECLGGSGVDKGRAWAEGLALPGRRHTEAILKLL